MNTPKLFWISSRISQEFWMLCVVKLNTVTQNTQTELQSTAGSPGLGSSCSGPGAALALGLLWHCCSLEPSQTSWLVSGWADTDTEAPGTLSSVNADPGMEENLKWFPCPGRSPQGVGPGSHGPSRAGKPRSRGDQGMETGEQTETRLWGEKMALVNLVTFMVRIQVLWLIQCPLQ